MNSPVRHLAVKDARGPSEFAASAPDLIRAIGQDDFVSLYFDQLQYLFGVDQFGLFALNDTGIREIFTHGPDRDCSDLGDDILMHQIKRQTQKTTLARASVSISGIDVPKGTDQVNHQRVLVCSRSAALSHGLRLERSPGRGHMTRDQIKILRQLAPILMSLIVRHFRLVDQQCRTAPQLTSLDQIEAILATRSDLTRRESQVCARILFGLFTNGIALDLGIGKESVMTYRKRAYQRLNIGSQHELLMWYLARWTDGP